VKIITKTPCCERPVKVPDTRTPIDRRCTKCRNWWRIDIRLVSQATVLSGRNIQSIHELTWTFIGKTT
jgi:hypothetical protein